MPSIEKPAVGRAAVIKSATDFNIKLSNKRLWLLLLPISFGLFVRFTDNPWHRMTNNSGGLLGNFWIVWAAMLVLLLLIFTWSLLGGELLSVTPQTIIFQNRLAGLPLSSTQLFVSEVSGIQVEYLPEVSIFSGSPQNLRQLAIQYGFGPGTIQVHANGKVYSFGRGLDQVEANYLLGEMNDFLYGPHVPN